MLPKINKFHYLSFAFIIIALVVILFSFGIINKRRNSHSIQPNNLDQITREEIEERAEAIKDDVQKILPKIEKYRPNRDGYPLYVKGELSREITIQSSSNIDEYKELVKDWFNENYTIFGLNDRDRDEITIDDIVVQQGHHFIHTALIISIHGVRVFGSKIKLHFDNVNPTHVKNLTSSFSSDIVNVQRIPRITQQQAIRNFLEYIKGGARDWEIVSNDLVILGKYFLNLPQSKLVYKIFIAKKEINDAYKELLGFIDAMTGETIHILDLTHELTVHSNIRTPHTREAIPEVGPTQYQNVYYQGDLLGRTDEKGNLVVSDPIDNPSQLEHKLKGKYAFPYQNLIEANTRAGQRGSLFGQNVLWQEPRLTYAYDELLAYYHVTEMAKFFKRSGYDMPYTAEISVATFGLRITGFLALGGNRDTPIRTARAPFRPVPRTFFHEYTHNLEQESIYDDSTISLPSTNSMNLQEGLADALARVS